MHYPRLEDIIRSRFEFGWFPDLELKSATSRLICLIIGVHALLGGFFMLVTSYALVV